MKIALLQMMVTADKETNLKRAEELVKKAAQGGADMAVLPEMFNCPYDNAFFFFFAYIIRFLIFLLIHKHCALQNQKCYS